ncbi:hypothetical protein DITRI_Ditri16bG0101100 [Diplodiscus trichospermus]
MLKSCLNIETFLLLRTQHPTSSRNLVDALVYIATNNDKKADQKQQQQRARTEREGDGNPEWNHTIRFEVSKTLFQDCGKVFIHSDLRLCATEESCSETNNWRSSRAPQGFDLKV